MAIGFSFSWLRLCIGGPCLEWLAVGLSRFLIYLALSSSFDHMVMWGCVSLWGKSLSWVAYQTMGGLSEQIQVLIFRHTTLTCEESPPAALPWSLAKWRGDHMVVWHDQSRWVQTRHAVATSCPLVRPDLVERWLHGGSVHSVSHALDPPYRRR